MERLTQINGNNEIYCIVDNKKIVVENIDMLKICQRLKLYEDLDERGIKRMTKIRNALKRRYQNEQSI